MADPPPSPPTNALSNRESGPTIQEPCGRSAAASSLRAVTLTLTTLVPTRSVKSSPRGSAPALSKHPTAFRIFGTLAASKGNPRRFFNFAPKHSSLEDRSTPQLKPASERAHRLSRLPDPLLASGAMADRDGVRLRSSRPVSMISAPISGSMHRPSLVDDARTASTGSSNSVMSAREPGGAIGDEKPVASGNGVAISIALAEPMLFLQGFDQSDPSSGATTMLRGSLHLRVIKPAKIKAITLKFRGRAETHWPEGIPPRKIDFKDVESIINHTWTFFNAQFQNAEGHGADTVRLLKGPTTTTRELDGPGVTSSSFDQFRRNSRLGREDIMAPKYTKRLSLQQIPSRSFETGDSGALMAQKGYRNFTPGNYIYNFELPIDSRLPETIDVELGNVKYELEAVVERSGAFRANLVGTKEVLMIRAPAENSLETVEPIAISRDWEDQLHYDIIISGKSFPLGSQVPIAFKLTPLAKVQCHRIKVYITENVQYYTSNKRVHRLEPTRKLQLFEKRADSTSSSTFPGSRVRITAGGGIPYDARAAAAAGDENTRGNPTNLLGNLDGDAVGPTEMEISVQLPSCVTMQSREPNERIHFDTTYHGIQVHHWIKIVMRLSKPDPEDPNKRRHFEISIDSPFNILSCRATQANTALPAYDSSGANTSMAESYECGCPDAVRCRAAASSLLPTLSNLRNEAAASSTSLSTSDSEVSSPGLARPAPAHVHDHNAGISRPMHLLRSPSFNPPPWSDDDPPPPLFTPPPLYESLIAGDPRGGLADYFARLADEIGDEDDEDSVSIAGRMDMPLTPGRRVNRSMDAPRGWERLGVDSSSGTQAAAPPPSSGLQMVDNAR